MPDLRIYKQILSISKRILAESDINMLLSVALDAAIELTNAERGLIILFQKNGDIIYQTARNLNHKDIDKPQFEISHTIIQKVKEDRKPIWLENALKDKKLKSQSSIRLRILSVLCFPLIYEKDCFGVIYLDNRSIQGIFTEKSQLLIKEFTELISSAVHNLSVKEGLKKQVTQLEKEIRNNYKLDTIVGHHPKMIEILKLIGHVAKTDASVLIQGESGTGKELIAQAIHYNSLRCEKPFIPINCGALPENLLESELFGHVKGAFTTAIYDKIGWFERARNGTIFLDEVSEMTPALQVKLLRVLQTGEFSPVGSTDIRQSDVRIIAATNKVLSKLVEKNIFREDLYYRLNVIIIDVPPLRKRKTDIPLLTQHFLKIFNKKGNKKKKYFSKESEIILLNYNYPGNIRELENIIRSSMILSEGELIQPHHLPQTLRENHGIDLLQNNITLTDIKRKAAEKAEQEFIIFCLESTNGHITKASEKAGINVSNFHKTMKKYQINANDFKSTKQNNSFV